MEPTRNFHDDDDNYTYDILPVAENYFDGAGDRKSSFDSFAGLDTARYRKQKLKNGIAVPVFGRRDDGWLATDDEVKRKCFNKLLKEYYSCPICRDPCIETTATSCGHKFCRECIDQWRKDNPQCPVCSVWIKSQHRLYSDDMFIESQLDYLSAGVKHRFLMAREKRLEQIFQEQGKNRIVKAVGQKFYNICFFSGKAAKRLGNKISSTSNTVLSKFWDRGENWTYLLMGILIIFVIALAFTSILPNSTQFAQYLWLASKKYDGKIPEEWLPIKEEQLPQLNVTLEMPEENSRTLLEVFVESVSAPIKYVFGKKAA